MEDALSLIITCGSPLVVNQFLKQLGIGKTSIQFESESHSIKNIFHMNGPVKSKLSLTHRACEISQG